MYIAQNPRLCIYNQAYIEDLDANKGIGRHRNVAKLHAISQSCF